MKRIILNVTAMTLFVGFTYSCQNNTKENNKHKQIEEVDKKAERHHSETNGLALDNGKRWIANTETTRGIENMIHIMNSSTEKDNVDAYERLTANLKTEFSLIFKNCTMTGEAHNQLHNFLVPIKGLFETLSSSDLKKCQESYSKLNKHLKEYKKYFK